MYKKTNFSKGNLSAQLLIAGTSLVLGEDEGLLFPATGSGNTFVGVIWGASYATPEGDASRELVVAYRASADTFTITRAQEGTSAKQWESGDQFMLVASAAVFDEYETSLGTKAIAPATNTDAYIPQWNGANSKTLKDGLAVPAGGLAGLTALGDKVDKVAGKGLSTNDYDDAAESKLAGIEASADVTDATNVAAAGAFMASGGTITGAITLGENTGVHFDNTLSADGKYMGFTIPGTAGTTLAFGDLCYYDPTDSRWELADANSAVGADGDATGLLGLCVLAAAGDGNDTTLLLWGTIRADDAFPTMTRNAPVYVSETAGDIVVAAPTTADAVIRRLGFASTSNDLFFNPSPDYTVHL